MSQEPDFTPMTAVDNAQGDRGPNNLTLLPRKKREEGHVVAGGGEGEEESENALWVGQVEEKLGSAGFAGEASGTGAVIFDGV